MRKRKSLFFYFLTAVMLLCAVSPAVLYAAEETGEEETEEYVEETPEAYYWTIETNEVKKWPQGPQVEAEGAAVMDIDTGAFLYSKNAEAKMYPASITKIMTTMVAIEHISEADLDKKVKASETALSPIGADSSQIWLSVGEKITMRSALYAIMLASANDAANVVAETVGGSIENFVQMMNDKAKELGCVNTHFVNPHGLHDDDHYTCAYDMALIAQAAYANPLFRQITKTVEYRIPKTKYMKEDRWLLNHQKMLYEDDEFTYDGCIGGKTGFTDDAWNTLVTYAKRDGRTLVCVELRVNGSWKTFNESAALLDYGFQNFRHEEVETQTDSTKLGQLAGVCRFGKAAVLNQPEMALSAVESKSAVAVTIPKKAKTSKLTCATKNGNEISYNFNGWEVGKETIHFQNPAIEILTPRVSARTTDQMSAGGIDTETGISETNENAGETSKGLEEKVDGYMDNVTLGFLNIWDSFNNWVNANEILAAGIGLVLILMLIPLLVIAYIRDKSARLIRKERERDEEERKKLEESIENKSVQEIEAEIRAELEKERLAREKEKQRKREAQEEERKMAEMEAIIAKKEAEKDRDVEGKQDFQEKQSAEEKQASEEKRDSEEKQTSEEKYGSEKKQASEGKQTFEEMSGCEEKQEAAQAGAVSRENSEESQEEKQENRTETDRSENAEVKDELGSTD